MISRVKFIKTPFLLYVKGNLQVLPVSSFPLPLNSNTHLDLISHTIHFMIDHGNRPHNI